MSKCLIDNTTNVLVTIVTLRVQARTYKNKALSALSLINNVHYMVALCYAFTLETLPS